MILILIKIELLSIAKEYAEYRIFFDFTNLWWL